MIESLEYEIFEVFSVTHPLEWCSNLCKMCRFCNYIGLD